ncbi:MAG: MotA/TolQ/ExbB proton channel family protein [Planctomycetes bacterium]|nr:MotA/TolQ/ExbB proton channel family protein [Planctomycetota bacterium]
MLELLDTIGAMLTTAPAGDAAGAAEAAEAVRIDSVFDFVMKGGIMMIPIGLCSLVTLTVVIERLVSLRRRRIIPAGFLPGLQKRLDGAGDLPGALAYCRKDGSSVARVFEAGIRRLGGPIDVVERNIQEAGQREVLGLRKHLRVLSVIAAVSPLLGLLGTIFGMITAFQTVATAAEALGRTELLAKGIYEAMITTAAGLIVAIPALVCYHWLSAKVQKLVMEIDAMSYEFVEDRATGGPRRAAATKRADAADGIGATRPKMAT